MSIILICCLSKSSLSTIGESIEICDLLHAFTSTLNSLEEVAFDKDELIAEVEGCIVSRLCTESSSKLPFL